MNTILIIPKKIIEPIEYEGIKFSKCTFIDIWLDDEPIDKIDNFEDSTVFWEELKKSTLCSGNYLIFTCYCGVAEDAGWDPISVEHTDDKVIWQFSRETDAKYEFDKIEYLEQVQSCENTLDLISYPLAVPIAVWPQ